MKKLFLSLLVLIVPVASFASETCFSIQVEDISYGSKMYNRVFCDGEKYFDTKMNVTQVLLPIPYNGGKKADKNLADAMTKKGFKETLAVKLLGTNTKDKTKIKLFEKSIAAADYCIARKFNKKTTGLQNQNVIFDVSLYCSTDQKEMSFQGVSDAELIEAVAQKGKFEKVLDADLEGTSTIGYSGIVTVFRAKK